jgi:hypothetical protein
MELNSAIWALNGYALSWPGETAHSPTQGYQNGAEQRDLGTEWLVELDRGSTGK